MGVSESYHDLQKDKKKQEREHKIPLRPVAPEHTSLASKITTDGGEGLSLSIKYAVETPDIPAPIMIISHSVGNSAVLR